MPRAFTYSALTLRVKASGESNREAWFLTAEEGLIRATVFGGPKSRLRAQVAPYHGGTLWIYHDPVRDSRKVSDFDVQSYRTGIRELWERAMTAGAVAETILSSRGGGGSWSEAAELAGTVLDLLDGADAALCSRIAAYFLWHWARILGVKPELSACASCARELKQDESLWYSVNKEALFCEKCSQIMANEEGERADFRLGAGGRLWLQRIESLPASALTRISLDTPSLEQVRTLSKAVMTIALGKRLQTWEGI